MTTNKRAAGETWLGLYIHIPFCLKKCSYCDFYSEAGQPRQLQKAYVQATMEELGFYSRSIGRGRRVDSVFIGGGTPTILDAEDIYRILEAARANFAVEPNAEITIESNPATLTPEKLDKYRKAGINRISMGVQSMDDSLLAFMGRAHTAQEVLDSYRLIKEAGFTNINLDVMFGVPGQTLEMWQETVRQVLELEPNHLSFYSLELAEGTQLYRQVTEEGLKETPTELDRQMYHYLLAQMKGHGYEQYEISNGALPGYSCRHNLKYWNLDEYLGIGASAHSYVNHVRWANQGDIFRYIEGVQTPPDRKALTTQAVDWIHHNSLADDMTDYAFTALRKNRGLDKEDFAKRFGMDFWQVFHGERPAFEGFLAEGKAAEEGQSIRITGKGMDMANQIISLFVGIDGEE